MAASLALAPALSWAQTPTSTVWSPRGPVKMIVPFAAGGTSDIVARLLAVKLGEALGQPVIVDNRAGAGGNIGISAVARAPADGLTLLLVSSAFAANPSLSPEKPPYDPTRQFTPITLAVMSPDVIVVRKDSPFMSLAALLAQAKRDPGRLTYSTPGKGNSVHLGGELLWQRAGVELLHVPYSGAAPAVQAVLAGQVDCALSALPAAQAHIAAGTLRALGVGSATRWAELPQVPTVAESGFEGYRSETMQAIFGPASLPPAAVARLNAEVQRILRSEPVRRQIHDLGFEPVGSSPAELGARVANEATRWVNVAAKANIRSD